MKNKIINTQSLNTDLATLFLRLLFGGLFVYYGYIKLVSFNQILPMFQDIIGIGSKLSLILVIFAELVCGFLVLVGCFTRLAIIPIFIAMAVAFFIAHAKDPFLVKQLAFLYLFLSPVIFVLGSGRFSLDALMREKRFMRNSGSEGSVVPVAPGASLT
jgi:putative oxidoreductase